MEKSRVNMHTDVRVKDVETHGSHRQYIRGGGGEEELSCSNCLVWFLVQWFDHT